MFVLYNSKADILDPLINNGGAKKQEHLRYSHGQKKWFVEDEKLSSEDFSSVFTKC